QRTPPARAASMRRSSSGALPSSSEPLRSIWWTTSSSRCSRTARSRGRAAEVTEAARAVSANTMRRMRRRFSSAALPVHRHSLSQVALDAGLVALAYYLVYRLRFDGAGGVPDLYHDLFVRTLGFVVIGDIALFMLF